MGKQINVSVLGKGEEKVSVEGTETVADLRNLLALDTDVVASLEDGTELSDTDTIKSDVNFSPNVEGGY